MTHSRSNSDSSSSEDCAEIVVKQAQIAINISDIKLLNYFCSKFNISPLSMLDLMIKNSKSETTINSNTDNSDVLLTSEDIDLLRNLNQESNADVLSMLATIHNKQLTQNTQERGIAGMFALMELFDMPSEHKVIKPKDLNEKELEMATIIGQGIFSGKIKRPPPEIPFESKATLK